MQFVVVLCIDHSGSHPVFSFSHVSITCRYSTVQYSGQHRVGQSIAGGMGNKRGEVHFCTFCCTTTMTMAVVSIPYWRWWDASRGEERSDEKRHGGSGAAARSPMFLLLNQSYLSLLGDQCNVWLDLLALMENRSNITQPLIKPIWPISVIAQQHKIQVLWPNPSHTTVRFQVLCCAKTRQKSPCETAEQFVPSYKYWPVYFSPGPGPGH